MTQEKGKKTILVVDDDVPSADFLAGQLDELYDIRIAANGKVALEIAQRKSDAPELILLDIKMPGMDGYEVCKKLKSGKRTRGIPVIFVTVLDEPKQETLGFDIGAADYITKPFNTDIVKARVRTHLELKAYRDNLELQVQKRTEEVRSLKQEINENQEEIILTLGNVVETKSKETANHVQRVREYINLLAIKAKLSEDEATILKVAAPMHDVGKIGIPESILNKPGKLTVEEYDIIKTHARIGYEILKLKKAKKSNSRILKAAAIIAHQHHERWDGQGYPRGLKGEDIHIYGRIAAIADVYDALATKRCYKDAWPPEMIREEFQAQSGKQFDPVLTDLFLRNFDLFLNILKDYPEENSNSR